MIRPVTQALFNAVMFDIRPRASAIVDFGIDTQEHYEALHAGVRAGEVTIDQLDAALGSGPKLTALVRSAPSNPHPDIVFRTSYDALYDEAA